MLKILIEIFMMFLWRWWCLLPRAMLFGWFIGSREMHHSIKHKIFVSKFCGDG